MSITGDLSTIITSRSFIKASKTPLQPDIIPVSNLDLIPDPNPVAAVYIYPRPLTGDFTSIIEAIRSSLPTTLNHFPTFAGRIAANPTTGLPEVLCNNAGAELVLARANVPLSSINFHYPNGLLACALLPYDPELALCVQVVGFPCGGYAVMFGSNHVLTDAYSLSLISSSFAEVARTGKLTAAPTHNRAVIQPRSPPRPSRAVQLAYTTRTPDEMINTLAGDVFVRRLYYVTGQNLDRLRDEARRDGRHPSATTMQAFSAYVWRALAKVVGESDTKCRMGWLVDGRRWLGGSDMKGYIGNVLTYAVGEAAVEEMRTAPLSTGVGAMAAAVREVANGKHFQGLVDWVEGHKGERMYSNVQLGTGSPAIVMSSVHNLQMSLDFGSGMPAFAMFATGGARLGAGFLGMVSSGKGDGSWLVLANLWPKVAAELEAGPDYMLKPLTADYLGLARTPVTRGLACRI